VRIVLVVPEIRLTGKGYMLTVKSSVEGFSALALGGKQLFKNNYYISVLLTA
jgi:hypothetical protein